MKLSTRKIIGIEVGVVLLWLGLGAIAQATLREYLQVAVLGVALLVGWWLLGWAKPRAREGRLATTLVVLVALVFQVVSFVFLGLKLGFVQNVYTWNWQSLFGVFLPVGLMIGLIEVLRGQMVARGHESRAVLILTTIFCAAIEVMWFWPIYNLVQAQDIFDLLMLVAMPALLKGCLLTYIAYEYDYRANVAYRLIMEMPTYLLPILPNVSEYLKTMFVIVLLVVLAMLMVRIHNQTVKELERGERPETDQKAWRKRAIRYSVMGVVTIVVAVYVGLLSGLFKYYLMAIGSGSMAPSMEVGDMILVEKTEDYPEIDEGEVLVFRHANMVMVHRVVGRAERAGNYYFKTQGDANESVDGWEVSQGDVIGVAKGKIVAFGYPTLWLNELFNGGKN